MSSFLERTARAVIDMHGTDLRNIAVVVPGQRAAAHLQKYLAQAVGKPFWAPQMLDMGRFLRQVAGAEQGGRSELLLSLHGLYDTLHSNGRTSLAEFLQWGPTALNDMSEVDHHLIDLDELYRDLRTYAEIEQWSLSLGDALSPGQQRAVALWQRTGQLHRALHDHMSATRRGTSGWVARQAAALAGSASLPWDAVWCVGANALEPATTAVLRALKRRGMLHLAWDTDAYYLDDRTQEAGRFIRRSIEALGPGLIPPMDLLRQQRRTIHAVAVPDARAQASYTAQWLADQPTDALTGTVVLLADEGTLPALVSSLPTEGRSLNISAGQPWRTWPVKGLVDLFIALHTEWHTALDLPVEKLRTCCLHPLLFTAAQKDPVLRVLHTCPTPRIGRARISDHRNAADALAPLFDALKMPDLLLAVPFLLEQLPALHPGNALVQEQAERTARGWTALCSLLNQAGAPATLELRERDVRDRLMEIDPIGYLGDPWQGAQVMGLLETRTLTPARLLIVGANEGTLPRSAQQQSYIPAELRRALGLPLRSDGEAVQAYHLLRLVQHTTEVTLVYHTGGGHEPAQPTRFIAQWEHELVPVSRTVLHRSTVLAPVDTNAARTIAIERSEWIDAALQRTANNGLSPSALGTWLRCPLDFFHRRVMRVEEPEERSGRLESRVLGSAVHEVLRKSVEPHLGTPITTAHIQHWRQGLGERLAAEVAAQVQGVTLDRGHHLLSLNMAEQAVDSYLQEEAQRLSRGTIITPLSVELELSHTLPNGIRIAGRCDRIEQRDGMVHILDLKTGSVRPEQLKLNSLERDAFSGQHAYALQLLIYAWAYLHGTPSASAVRSGLIPLQQRSRSEGLWLSVADDTMITRSMLEPITTLLTDLSNEIVNGTDALRHHPDSSYCVCCLGA